MLSQIRAPNRNLIVENGSGHVYTEIPVLRSLRKPNEIPGKKMRAWREEGFFWVACVPSHGPQSTVFTVFSLYGWLSKMEFLAVGR
jgi:hypothetical protein